MDLAAGAARGFGLEFDFDLDFDQPIPQLPLDGRHR